MTAAELIPHDALSHRAKSNITSAISSEKLTGTKQNAMGR
jgi:hypothetical protein